MWHYDIQETPEFKKSATRVALQVLRMGLKGHYAAQAWVRKMEDEEKYLVKVKRGGSILIKGPLSSPTVRLKDCDIEEIG